jgi:hypothetical protein
MSTPNTRATQSPWMKLTVVESPLRGIPPERCPAFLRPFVERVLRERNRHFAFRCVRAEIDRGRAPFASHVFFDQPGLLDDANPKQRTAGMAIGQAWSAVDQCRVRKFYLNRGHSSGMEFGKTKAREFCQVIHPLHLVDYRPLALWRCVLAVVLRSLLGGVYGR